MTATASNTYTVYRLPNFIALFFLTDPKFFRRFQVETSEMKKHTNIHRIFKKINNTETRI